MAPLAPSLYSRLQLLEHENRIQNEAINRLQSQNERLSLTISRLHLSHDFGHETSHKTHKPHNLQRPLTSHSRETSHDKQKNQANDIYQQLLRPSASSQQPRPRSSPTDLSRPPTQFMNVQLPSSSVDAAAFNAASKIIVPCNASTICSHGPACRKEFCNLGHSSFFCCSHGVHCMQPAACGIMSLSEARRLQQLHFNMHALPPATSTSGAASGEQRYCVWVHAHCDKFQPRSDRLCHSGFREVRVLSDARQPRNCASWALFRNISCFSSRENHGNGFSAILLRRVVERQLPSLFLQLAADSFTFASAASAMEALQLMLTDAKMPVSTVHVM